MVVVLTQGLRFLKLGYDCQKKKKKRPPPLTQLQNEDG